MSKDIRGFFDEYRWLSNMWSCGVEYDSKMFPSSEHAYVYAKSPSEENFKILLEKTPTEAKKFGRDVILVDNWNDIRLKVMKDIIWDKFTRNEDLRDKLLATEDSYIEETNYWKDTFWGVCDDVGQNHLGKIIMATRNELKMFFL